jgi:hypothetical protein
MATSRGKAETFVKELNQAVTDIRTRLSIDPADVVVTATVAVLDSVRYSSREDED